MSIIVSLLRGSAFVNLIVSFLLSLATGKPLTMLRPNDINLAYCWISVALARHGNAATELHSVPSTFYLLPSECSSGWYSRTRKRLPRVKVVYPMWKTSYAQVNLLCIGIHQGSEWESQAWVLYSMRYAVIVQHKIWPFTQRPAELLVCLHSDHDACEGLPFLQLVIECTQLFLDPT